MVSRDYRTEVGLAVVDRKVAWPIGAVICAACIAGAVWASVKYAPAPVEPEDAPPAKAVAQR